MLRHNQSLLYDLLYYLPSKVIPAVLGFILVVLLTHSLTPNEFGQYATILAIVNLSDSLVSAWLRQSILRFYPDYQVDGNTGEFQEKLLSLVVPATLMVGLATGTVMRALGYGIDQIMLAVEVLIAQIAFSYLTTLYQSGRLSRHYATVVIIQSAVQLAWVLGLVYLARGGYALAVLGVAAGYMSGVLYVFLNRGKMNIDIRLSLKKLDWAFIREILAYGLPMSVWVLSFQSLFLANRLIIGWLRSLEEVGIYVSAYDLINGSLSLIITPILLAAHPVILQLWTVTNQATGIEELIQRILRNLLLLFVPIFFFSLTVNDEIFLALGPGFDIKGWVVPVLVANVFFGGFSMYVHKGLEIAKRTGVMMGVALVTAFVNVTLNLLLVSEYGYTAAAVIALISHVFYTVVVYTFSRHYVRVRIPWKSVLRICVAGGSAGMCLWLLKQAVIKTTIDSTLGIGIGVLLCSCVYVIGLIVSGEVMLQGQPLLAVVSGCRLDEVTKRVR